MTSLIERLRAFVDAQAKQENLWFEHEHITEAILQRALRAAHDALEHAIAGLEAAAALSSIEHDGHLRQHVVRLIADLRAAGSYPTTRSAWGIWNKDIREAEAALLALPKDAQEGKG